MDSDERIKAIAWSGLLMAVAVGLICAHWTEWKLATAAGIISFFVLCEIIGKLVPKEPKP